MVDFDRLEGLIKQQGKKKSHLCAMAGKGRGYISDAKNGNGTVSDEALEIFAAELGTTVAYLRHETDDVGVKKAPAGEGGHVSEDEIKIALFGGGGEVTDEMWNEALFAVELIKKRHEKGRE